MKELPEQRSRVMRAVKERDTTPEMIVRRLVHSLGYRYRLHRKDLPGKPDLVFPKLRKIVFVHGCFWHGHGCIRGCRVPKTNTDYWREKIRRNSERDISHMAALKAAGWQVAVLWECELRNSTSLRARLTKFLCA